MFSCGCAELFLYMRISLTTVKLYVLNSLKMVMLHRQSFDSIIKVYTVAASPNWFMPWQTKQQRESTGSGFIIEGNRTSIYLRNLMIAQHNPNVTCEYCGKSNLQYF